MSIPLFYHECVTSDYDMVVKHVLGYNEHYYRMFEGDFSSVNPDRNASDISINSYSEQDTITNNILEDVQLPKRSSSNNNDNSSNTKNTLDKCLSHRNEKLTVMCLNCCGIKSRLQYPEFINLIQSNDIICLVETKTDDLDIIECPGYKFLMKNRRKITNRRSGGIIVGYKEKLDCHIEFISTDCKFVLWFKCNESLFNTDQPVIFGVIYIPPEYTKYTSDEAFNEIEQEYLSLSEQTKYVCLLGDFNARTGTDLDFVKIDQNEHLAYDISEFIEDFTGRLDALNFSVKRVNMDKTKNRYGNFLLNFCKGNCFFILNGRVGNDKNIGKLTCRNASVVDYCICSPELLFSIYDFDVLDTSKLYSDIHSPILVTFKTDNVNRIHENFNPKGNGIDTQNIKPWDNEKVNEFINNIDINKISLLEQKLIVQSNENDITAETIDSLLNDLKDILLNSASETLGIRVIKNTKNDNHIDNKTNKPWFDNECKNFRRNFRKAKRKFKSNPTIQNKTLMIETEKQYKNIMDNKYKSFCKKLSDELHDASNDNPKKFWKMLGTHKRKKQPNIEMKPLYDFFKKLNSNSINDEDSDELHMENPTLITNYHINGPISQEEIRKCVLNLKNDKACGDDNIINEYIKNTLDKFLNIYEKLFNIIFDTGVIPSSWLSGIIKPIYKNKGDSNNPKNYRPITIVSCLGKLFTSILNKRLNSYSDEFDILKENQSGFREQYSTLDNIYTIYTLFQILKNKKKKLYCAFIDFEKAFDKVWRDGLFHKLLQNGINGKMYNVIHNMYDNIKSCISHNNSKSDFFKCEMGVRQGENLSPFLFSIFLNDLEDFFVSQNIDGLTSVSEDIEKELEIFLKIFLLLYADDTALLSESPKELQVKLNAFEVYCDMWKLKVNVDKTKIMIFGLGRINAKEEYFFKGSKIDIVKDFEYLGITFTKTCNFDLTKKRLADKALRAMYEVLKIGRLYKLSVKLLLELFDKMIKPIMLYGCEIWGFGKNVVLERIHLKFCKIILNLKSSTPNYMVYGELGRFPIDIDIKIRCISFWFRLATGKEQKMSNIMYRLSKKLFDQGNRTYKLLAFIKSIIDECGCSYIWETNILPNISVLKYFIKQRLHDQFRQNWHTHIMDSAKSINYRLFKPELEFEIYLNILKNKDAITFCRFRTTNNYLPIETGRWRNIPRENRTCNVCNSGKLGDEYHYIFECSVFNEDRKRFLPKYYLRNQNTLKFSMLMSTRKPALLHKLCKFIKLINSSV